MIERNLQNEAMKILLFTICIICHVSCSHAQTSEEISKQADSLYLAKNYVLAAPLYVKSAATGEFNVSKYNNYYNAACSYALINNKNSALKYLELAVKYGWNDLEHTKADNDLVSLHYEKKWNKIIASIIPASTADPLKVQIITTDIDNFWKAYDMAEKDTAIRAAIYKKYYLDAGTPGLQDYWSTKIRNMNSFVKDHDARKKFYAAIRPVTLKVKDQQQQIMKYFIRLKELYPETRFPNIYFVIGNLTSGGTASGNGLLIGTEMSSKAPGIPLEELATWEIHSVSDFNTIPLMVIHEMIHFQQGSMADDTTLLKAAIGEGMANFLGLLAADTITEGRLDEFAKGKEKTIWEGFKKEMYQNKIDNWLYNGDHETPDRPADLGYWMGQQICKAYYDNANDKKKAIYEMLHIKDYRKFVEDSKIDEKMK